MEQSKTNYNCVFEMSNIPTTLPLAQQSDTSTIRTRNTDESQRKIHLVGHILHLITGAKLPSIRQVLQVFFFNMRIVRLNSREILILRITETIQSLTGIDHPRMLDTLIITPVRRLIFPYLIAVLNKVRRLA